jgi:hypothetical protein
VHLPAIAHLRSNPAPRPHCGGTIFLDGSIGLTGLKAQRLRPPKIRSAALAGNATQPYAGDEGAEVACPKESRVHESQWAVIAVLSVAACGRSPATSAIASYGNDARDESASGSCGGCPSEGSTSSSGTGSNDVRSSNPQGDVAEGSTGERVDADQAKSKIPRWHRAVAAACSQARPAGVAPPTCHLTGATVGLCSTDQDCSSGPNGRCNCQRIGGTTQSQNTCSYDACQSDSDCHGGVCDCRENPINGSSSSDSPTVCLTGNCHVDSDCGGGGYCSPSPAPGCGATSWFGYFCHTPNDQCVDDVDCGDGSGYCAYDGTASRWLCSSGLCRDG